MKCCLAWGYHAVGTRGRRGGGVHRHKQVVVVVVVVVVGGEGRLNVQYRTEPTQSSGIGASGCYG